jgi:hypothetical protein
LHHDSFIGVTFTAGANTPADLFPWLLQIFASEQGGDCCTTLSNGWSLPASARYDKPPVEVGVGLPLALL